MELERVIRATDREGRMGRTRLDPVELRIRAVFADAGSELIRNLRAEFANAERRNSADALVTVDEAAAQLSTSRQRIYRYFKSGELEPIKMGRNTRIRMSDVQRLMEGTAA